jgi:hypothetical protein
VTDSDRLCVSHRKVQNRQAVCGIHIFRALRGWMRLWSTQIPGWFAPRSLLLSFGSERSWWRACGGGRRCRRRCRQQIMAMALKFAVPNCGFVGGRSLNLSLPTSQIKEAFLILDETPPLPLSAPVLNCHCAGLRIHPVGIFAQNRRRPHIRCANFFIY